MEITDELNTDKNKNKNKLNERLKEFKNTIESKETEKMYIMALHDICARIDLAVSTFMNATTELNNAKNHYLKLLAQIRQEQEAGIPKPS